VDCIVLPLPRRTPLPGWVACVPQGSRATLACVERGGDGPPRVSWVDSCAWADAGAALRQLRRSRALQRRRNVAVLERSSYRLVPLDAPELPREEWRAAVRWQLKDLVDFPVEAASIDVLEIPGDPARRRAAQMLAVAAAHEALRPLVRAASDAGMPWQALDIAETALRNIGALVEPAGRAQALLHVGERESLLVITAAGELLLSRPLDATLARLTAADAAAREEAFDHTGLELQRTLDGFDRLFSHLSLARLLVAPGAGLEAFCAHVQELSFVPVQPLDLAGALDLSAVPELADPALLSHHLGAIGAALREG
jgi:MSHA biogenesis protein MshI